MTSEILCPRDLCDRDVLSALEDAVAAERQATARLIELLAEVDSRKLYAQQGCSSLFSYCVRHAARCSARTIVERPTLARVTFPPRSSVRCGSATEGSAGFAENRDAAPKLAFWNFITSCRLRTGVRRRSPTFSCAVAAIINTRRICGLVCAARSRFAKRAPSLAAESNSVRPWT